MEKGETDMQNMDDIRDTLVRELDGLLSHSPSLVAESTRNRLGGSRKAILRRWAHAYAGGACMTCGKATHLDADQHDPDAAQLGHLIPAATITPNAPRGMEGGYLAPFIANQCNECNSRLGDAPVDIGTMARPDVVPMEWPTLSRRNPVA